MPSLRSILWSRSAAVCAILLATAALSQTLTIAPAAPEADGTDAVTTTGPAPEPAAAPRLAYPGEGAAPAGLSAAALPLQSLSPEETEEEVSPMFGRRGPLTPREQAMAEVAWSYFVERYQPETGLVNAVGSFPSTTMWDTASISARSSPPASSASSTSANSTTAPP